MKHHNTKIRPEFFAAVLTGEKTFEIRNNSDRDYEPGDTVTLKEWQPDHDDNGKMLATGRYTGREAAIRITYVTRYKQRRNFVVYAFKLEGASANAGAA